MSLSSLHAGLSVSTVKLFPVTCEYIKGEKQFYYRAQKFYEDVPASEEGMMGDFVEISNVDLEGSRQFLKRFVVSDPQIRSPTETSERLCCLQDLHMLPLISAHIVFP